MLHLFRTLVAVALMVSAGASLANDEADRLRLARELMVVNQVTKSIDTMSSTLTTALKPIITRGDAKIEKDFDFVMSIVKPEFEPFRVQMVDDLAQIYARSFTKDELEQLLTFFRSPAGQKMVTLTPSIMQSLTTIGQSYAAKASPQIIEKIKAELRKRGHNI